MVRQSLSKMFGFHQIEENNENVKELDITVIKTNPFQPRKYFDPIQLDDLAKSIKQYGVIQPIIVRKIDNTYELVAGERRLRASLRIGLNTIPAIVRELSNKEIAEIAMIENLQREDLNFFEEAEGYKSLIDEFSLTQEEVAKKVGKSQSTIANKLRLLKLPDNVKENITLEIITERHARALLKLNNEDMQMEVLKEIYLKELNVRETDLLVEEYINATEETEKKETKKKKVVRVFKDMRLYINTIKSAVTAIEDAGLDVTMKEEFYDDYVEVLIKIPKYKQ